MGICRNPFLLQQPGTLVLLLFFGIAFSTDARDDASFPSAAQVPTSIPAEAIRHNNLGAALMDAGIKDPNYFPEAIKEFRAALQQAPRYQTARINLGIAYYYSGNGEEALGVLESLQRESPDQPQANFMLGLLYETHGEYAKAIPFYAKITRLDPSDAKAWFHLGYCYGSNRQYAEAIEPLRRAAGLEPYQRQFRYYLFLTLNRAGQAPEARVEMENFRKLETSDVRAGSSPKNALEYLRQGKYAEAIADSLPEPEVSRPPAQYSDVAAQLNIHFHHRGPARDEMLERILRGEPTPRAWFCNPGKRRALIASLSAGCSFADYNNDGRLDVFLVNSDGHHALFEQQKDGRFREKAEQAGLGLKMGPGMACAWGDYDNDGWPDLLVTGYGDVRLFRNNKGKFEDVTASAGIAKVIKPETWAMGAAFADVDHDGDLDIYIPCLVNITQIPNRPNVSFPKDFPSQPHLLFRNNLNGTFTEISTLAKTDGGGLRTRAVWFSDINNDRAIDFALLSMEGKPKTYLNQSDGTFAPSSLMPQNPPLAVAPGESHAYGDFNNDGAVDEIIVRSGQAAILNRNEQKPVHWLTVRLQGYAEPGKLKSNRMGIGTKMELRSVGRWETKELRAGNGSSGSDAPEIYFDLGGEKRVDFVRAIFPSGVRWTLRDPPLNQRIQLDEPLLDVNSCPAVFSWDGTRFQFIADTISAGILGELIAPGRYSKPDPDEWLRITGNQLQPGPHGTLDLRWADPLEEVTYLDAVKLLAVDHPGDIQLFTNERMLNKPGNRAIVQLYGLANILPLAQAMDHHGHDVGKALEKVDRRYFDDFRMLPYKGFAEDWSLTLDLGNLAGNPAPVLLIQSWSYWNSSAAIVAAAQAGYRLWGPVLEIQNAEGRWRKVTADMGVSAGMLRPMVLDLSKWLRKDEHKVRIRSNRMLYYDQILVAQRLLEQSLEEPGPDNLSLRKHEMPLLCAQLRWLGYPRRVLPDGRLPEIFDYSRIEPRADWGLHAGMLTRYGNVVPLLAARDNRFVIMEHGEEVALSFDAKSLPPLAPRCHRTYFLYSCGYEKGYELHSAQSTTVEPLPFKMMGSYPGKKRDQLWRDKAYWEYLMEWNARPSFIRQ